MENRAYDVVVVGGGAAGLSAALVLGRARRRVAVVDAGAPRNAPAAHMQGFLSRDGMPPADLLAAGRAEVTGYGVELIEDQVVGDRAGFAVRLAGGRVLSGAAASWSRPASATSCPTSPASASGGAGISCTARTATGGRSATSRSACSAPARLGPACTTRPAVVRRRRLLRPHLRPHRGRARAAGRTRDPRRRRRGRPARGRGRPADRRRARPTAA